jgi:hypothetical protein
MKLPDFTADFDLNELRKKMRADLREFVIQMTAGPSLTTDQVERLAREGIEIPLDEVEVLEDGTLAYKGTRVVLYIRDVKQYRRAEPNLPRFHVSDCDTLQEMRAKNRYGRYVVATRDTGEFEIRLMSYGSSQFSKSDKELSVCQNCLAKIDWNEFTRHRHVSNKKAEIVSSFTLKAYFGKYRKTFIRSMPLHTERSAPENNYPKDWAVIAESIKIKRNFRCEKCGIDLSKWKKYLHAHHKNGLQNDVSEDNIAILCLEHHAAEPMHGHMKNSDYREFMRLRSLGQIK